MLTLGACVGAHAALEQVLVWTLGTPMVALAVAALDRRNAERRRLDLLGLLLVGQELHEALVADDRGGRVHARRIVFGRAAFFPLLVNGN